MKGLLTVLLLFFVTSLLGQGFTYSYVDPCSKKLKTLYVNNNQNVTINYFDDKSVCGTFDLMVDKPEIQAVGTVKLNGTFKVETK